MQNDNTIKATEAQTEDLELDLFSDELEDRSNPAAAGTLFCLSTEGCVCTISSISPSASA